MNALGATVDYTALGFDPAPGELASVDASAEQYRVVADRLRRAMDAIESIVDQSGVWEGEASEAFARRVDELPDYLGKATESMGRASKALADWSDALGDMQQRARELEIRARQARKETEAARDNPAFELANQTFTDPEALRAAQRALDEAARRLTVAVDQLESVLEAAERLKREHDEAAQRIAKLIDKAREMAPDEPGMFGKAFEALGDAFGEMVADTLDLVEDITQEITDFIEDNAELIAEVSTILGDISTVIGTAADFLPPPADSIVGGVSLALGVTALGGHVVAGAAGADISTETYILDAVGVGTGLVGLIPGVPGGVANAAFQAGWEGAARLNGEDGGTTVGKFIPRDERQWITAGAGVLFPPVGAAVPLENFGRDWVGGVTEAVGQDNAGQAERDRQRAEERVWQD